MYQNACGGAAASAGVCVEADRECHSLISKEPAPVVKHDYSGFDIVKATQVRIIIYILVTIYINSCRSNVNFWVLNETAFKKLNTVNRRTERTRYGSLQRQTLFVMNLCAVLIEI